MHKGLISVIVAVYNVEKYIDKCIKSIVQQTYEKLEIILVDDGSTDDSGNICNSWQKRDMRIKVYHKKNGGLSEARNFGLQYVNGEYISFVDGDDYLEEIMFDTLFKNRVYKGITICGFYLDYSTNKVIQSYDTQLLTPKETVRAYLLDELKGSEGEKIRIGSYAWNKLYYYSLFENITYPLHMKFEDVFIIIPLLLKASKIQIISIPLYNYVQRGDSITGSTNIYFDLILARKLQTTQVINDTNQKIVKILLFRVAFDVFKKIDGIIGSKENFFQKEFCKKILDDIIKEKKVLPKKDICKYYLYKFLPGLYKAISMVKNINNGLSGINREK